MPAPRARSRVLITKMSDLYLGLDTSNYTTSLAVCNDDGKILLNFKRLLTVKDGERGLRQSEAVFQHTVNLEEASIALSGFLPFCAGDIAAVGYSARPRDVEGSYMPCFLVGASSAKVAASALGAPAYPFSHQAGHVAAAIYGAGCSHLLGEEFAAFHVSGGTTELLYVRSGGNGDMNIERIGGTKDLNAGQVIDRAGVMMGFPFPCGKYIEGAALENKKKVPRYHGCVNGFDCNLSGIENKASALYAKTGDRSLVSAFVLNAVGDALVMMTDGLLACYPSLPVVYSGGVMSCSLLKERLSDSGRYFAPSEFSSDNAAGIAYLTMLRHGRR